MLSSIFKNMFIFSIMGVSLHATAGGNTNPFSGHWKQNAISDNMTAEIYISKQSDGSFGVHHFGGVSALESSLCQQTASTTLLCDNKKTIEVNTTNHTLSANGMLFIPNNMECSKEHPCATVDSNGFYSDDATGASIFYSTASCAENKSCTKSQAIFPGFPNIVKMDCVRERTNLRYVKCFNSEATNNSLEMIFKITSQNSIQAWNKNSVENLMRPTESDGSYTSAQGYRLEATPGWDHEDFGHFLNLLSPTGSLVAELSACVYKDENNIECKLDDNDFETASITRLSVCKDGSFSSTDHNPTSAVFVLSSSAKNFTYNGMEFLQR